MQSSPDTCRNLQNLAAEGGKSLDQLVQVATAIFYNRNLEKERRKDKHQGGTDHSQVSDYFRSRP
jgi:hypothetical protein